MIATLWPGVVALLAYQLVGIIMSPKDERSSYAGHWLALLVWPVLEAIAWVAGLFRHFRVKVKPRGRLSEEEKQRLGRDWGRDAWFEGSWGPFHTGHWWREYRGDALVGRWWGISFPWTRRPDDAYDEPRGPYGITIIRTVTL